VLRDNIATDEELGLPTTAGSYALLGMPVKKDAFVVRKLREAGAISESCLFYGLVSSTDSSLGVENVSYETRWLTRLVRLL
jgi:hypothetical protein